MANQKNEKIGEQDQTAHYSINKDKTSWVVPGLLALIALLLILGITHNWNRPERHFTTFGGAGMGMMRQERGLIRTGGPAGTNESHLVGTVTAVNGSSFTLAGGGSTNEVTTNSSTQYQNGSQVKVNDTVAVSGTTNNGTFTASEIVINP